MSEDKSITKICLDMQKIVDGDILPTKDVIDNTKSQLNMFLVAQARKELERIIKLTETLDMLQEKYQSKITQYIADHDDDTAVMYLPNMIKNITECMNRSNELISKVVSNDKIMNFSFVTNNNSVNVSDNTVNIDNNIESINLEDPASRMKVRDTVQALINMLDNNNNENRGENNE